jgi:hypothetical protein
VPCVRHEDRPIGCGRDPEGFREARARPNSVIGARDTVAREHRYSCLPVLFERWDWRWLQLLPDIGSGSREWHEDNDQYSEDNANHCDSVRRRENL